MLVGYLEGVKGYRLWCLEKGHSRAVISRSVVFKEAEMFYPNSKDKENDDLVVEDGRA